MKHSAKITLVLLAIFLIAQYVGLGIVYNYVDFEKSEETGEMEFKTLPIGDRPPVEENTSFIPIIIAVLVGTVILLLLIKFKLHLVWKLWFLLAVGMALGISFAPFLGKWVGFGLAFILAGWKIYKPNFWVHNFTELFIYGGLAAIFVPLFNIFSVSILMVLIAGYDAYAVWKSKHMVTLAKGQAKANVFAGLLVPYSLKTMKSTKAKKALKKTAKKVARKSAKKVAKKLKTKTREVRTAILGGGDIGFPLIFAGVLLKEMGLWQALVIPLFALAGLGYLLYIGDEKKFYPAMPFIGAGCFLGLGFVWLIGIVV